MLRVLLMACLVGCGATPLPGAPVPGAACVTSSRWGGAQPECISAREVAYCESGKWVEYACPGECRNAQEYKCDWSAARAGDSCPPGVENNSFCETSTQQVKCLEGKWVAKGCGACTVESATFATCS